MRDLVACAFFSVLAGCSAFVPIQTLDKTGIDVLKEASELPIVSDAEAKKMQVLGEVIGYSCMNKSTEPRATRVGALDQAKIAAVQRGAKAISVPSCREGGVSLIKNCWHSWECKTTALR